jgi:hypothetical protein
MIAILLCRVILNRCEETEGRIEKYHKIAATVDKNSVGEAVAKTHGH